MTQEELTALAEKVKAGTATEAEQITFQKELNKLLSEMKGILEE